MNAYYAVYLYAQVTNHKQLLDFSHTMLMMEIHSVKYYWHMNYDLTDDSLDINPSDDDDDDAVVGDHIDGDITTDRDALLSFHSSTRMNRTSARNKNSKYGYLFASDNQNRNYQNDYRIYHAKNSIYDKLFASTRMVGNVGALDVTTSTWFGANVEYVHGINM